MGAPINNALNVYEVILAGIRAGEGSSSVNYQFVFHYRVSTLTAAPTKTALDTIFQASIAVPLIACLNNTFTQQHNTVRKVNDVTDAATPFSHAVVGGVAGDSMSSQDAAYILLRTGNRKAFYRGSKHLGPLSEGDTTAGTADILNAAALARFATLTAALVAPFTDALGNVWTLGILSRTLPLTNLKTNPVNFWITDVNQVLVNQRVGNMKRRKVASVY